MHIPLKDCHSPIRACLAPVALSKGPNSLLIERRVAFSPTLACPPPARAVHWGLPAPAERCHGQRASRPRPTGMLPAGSAHLRAGLVGSDPRNASAVPCAALRGQRKAVPGPALSPRTTPSALWSPAAGERGALCIIELDRRYSNINYKSKVYKVLTKRCFTSREEQVSL